MAPNYTQAAPGATKITLNSGPVFTENGPKYWLVVISL